MIHLAAITMTAQLVLVADVPRFNTRPSCQAAAEASIELGRSSENCLDDERNAREQLQKSWGDFSGSDKSHCLGLVSAGGQPSYVELLSCLEMSRDARVIAAQRSKAQGGKDSSSTDLSTTGAGPMATPTQRPKR